MTLTLISYDDQRAVMDGTMTVDEARRRGYARTRRGRGTVHVDRAFLSDLLNELFPDGLTDDCPARRAKVAA